MAVVDEPVWMTYAGFVFDLLASLASLIAIFLAIKAYQVGVRSYEVAKDQNRRTLELEFLKDLGASLGGFLHTRVLKEIPEHAYTPSDDILSHFLIFKEGELPTWQFLIDNNRYEQVGEYVLRDPVWGPDLRGHESYDWASLDGAIVAILYRELHDAMRKRVE